MTDYETASPVMAEFLARCDAEFERARLEALEAVAGVKEKHLRELGAVLSIEAALDAKRQVMRYGAPGLTEDDIMPHFRRLLGQVESNKKLIAKFTAKAEAAEAEARKGREIARRNAQVGIDRAEAAVLAECERHEQALARLTTPEAIDAEDKRHERRLAELSRKVDGALAALAAATD